jgi:endonuclease/exonuclease/phosphatase family metal-dependent hydrolase
VIATHLGLGFGERKKQVDALCRALDDDRPTVLMGDFNNWIRFRSAQLFLERRFASYTRVRSFPARFPLFALDRVYCRPAGMLATASAVTTARHLSDHLPVLAELSFPPLGSKS